VDGCTECGFVFAQLDPGSLPAALRSGAGAVRGALEHAQALGRAQVRPGPAVWSPLEYACHVRDVLLVQRDRVILALVEDVPDFVPMYREQRVDLVAYGGEDAAEVSVELTVAGNLTAKVFAALSPHQLARRCIYNFPERAERDITWLGRQTVHETHHHLGDMQRALQAAATGTP